MLYTVARIGAAVGMRARDYYEEGDYFICRLHEKAGKLHHVPANHVLEGYMKTYLDSSGIREAKNSPLFRSMPYGKVSVNRLRENNALDMIKRRAKDAGLPGTCDYNSGPSPAVNLANHTAMRIARIYDKRDRVIRRTSVERIVY